MLETDEVDIDYFTPAGSTSLASLFAKGSAAETKENTSLKYVPPPPPEKSRTDEVKPTQWIFTCAVQGFQWSDSRYLSNRLGLAILKIVKTNSHSIILYDSNKTTVSCVTISPKLNIHISGVNTITYYDNAQKYWCIQTSNDDMNKILQLLKDLQVTLINQPHPETDVEHPSNDKVFNKDDILLKDKKHEEEHEVDTDFYINQKTKDSILKRMASMGHSVLPSQGSARGRTSDSSDSNDIDDIKTNIRHKPPKIPPKRFTDLSLQENEKNSSKVINKLNMDERTLGLSKSISTTPSGGDMNVFISEQKISNSELRINVNRVSDKLDVVLERLNIISIDKNNSFSNFQNDIVQKLIREYESKIKNYENVMSMQGIDFQSIKVLAKSHLDENVSDNYKDNMANKDKIEELEKECKNKDDLIITLKKEISVLNESTFHINDRNKYEIDKLAMEIESLNENLTIKNKELDSLRNNPSCINVSNHETCDIENKVKKIMNDTFEAISVNFEDKTAYSGETIKSIIGKVIKKTTIQALQEL